MSIDDIKALNYVDVEEGDSFYKVSVSGAHVLGTIYSNLGDYCSSKLFYFPKKADLGEYKIYSDKKDNEIKELQEEYFKKLYMNDNEQHTVLQ